MWSNVIYVPILIGWAKVPIAINLKFVSDQMMPLQDNWPLVTFQLWLIVCVNPYIK